MKRYIDADKLKETIASNVYLVSDCINSRDYGMFWTGGIEKAIDEQPTADVVEVVRCKDCKHNVGVRDNTGFYEYDIVCEYWESDGLYSTDFCSYGERRTDEAD